jgi:Zn-dependent membrane protease YugP
MYPIFFDPLFLCFMIPAAIMGFAAQAAIKSRFQKYSNVRTMRGLTGARVAREILDSNGLYDVGVEETQGFLSDHYDPRSRVLRLSPDVARQPSISAVGVAAHEAGHAIQHQKGYMPLQIRSAMVPAVQFGSNLAPMLIFGGIMLQILFSQAATLGYAIAWLGVIGYGLAALFSIVTLPVELDASSRAKKLLYQYNIVDKQELAGVTAVLNAAAWTYVVAAIAALLQLAYWILRLSARRD